MKFKCGPLGLVMLAALTGCGGSSQPQARDTAAKPVDGRELRQKYTDALESTKDYTAQKKDEFLAAMGRNMKELDARMDELAKKTEGYKDDARVEADKVMAALREQRDALGKKYDALKKTGEDTWEKGQADVASAWSKMEKAYENAKSKFN
jgi:hypothetical protein